jgi:hypothetical protein
MRANTVERRTELLKMEGLGFSESEIVKELTEKFQVATRTIYYDFQTRNKWQLSSDAYKHYLKALNCLQQIYNRASLILITNTNNTNAQIGALRVMADIAIKQTELSGYKPAPFTPDEIKLSWDDRTQRRVDSIVWKKVVDSLTPEEKATLDKITDLDRHIRLEFEKHPELIPKEESIH